MLGVFDLNTPAIVNSLWQDECTFAICNLDSVLEILDILG